MGRKPFLEESLIYYGRTGEFPEGLDEKKRDRVRQLADLFEKHCRGEITFYKLKQVSGVQGSSIRPLMNAYIEARDNAEI